jgi:vacuolar-type H+-ATPase subunit I/STV1
MKVLMVVLAAAVVGLGGLSLYLQIQTAQGKNEVTMRTQDLERERKQKESLQLNFDSMRAEKDQEIQKQNAKLSELSDLQATVKTLREEVTAKADLAKIAQDKVDQARAMSETAKQEREKLVQDLTQIRTDHEALVTRLADAKAVAEGLATEAQKVVAEKTVLTEKLVVAEAECENLKKTLEKLQGLVPKLAGKEVEGKVAEIVPGGKVILSGLSQKPEVDLEFSVFRGSDFIGRVKVHKAFENYAGANVTYLIPGKEVKVGDVVKTGFPEKK